MSRKQNMEHGDLQSRFKSYLISSRLIESGDKILLAISGGLDSVALLHLLALLQREMNLTLNVVHVHHGLRGKEADRDLEFTRELAEKLELPFHFQKVDTREYAKTHKLALEECARVLRYQAFDEVLTEIHAPKLATAHTADDQVETILDHFLRGSGVTGLRGMTSVRGAYIRPLLGFTRHELEQFVSENRFPFVEDSSNRDLNFKRNRIRHELIPYLKKHFNPNLTGSLARTVMILDENEAFLTEFAANAYKSLVSLQKKNEIILEIKPFLSYFSIIQKYILIHASELLGVSRAAWTFEKLSRVLTAISSRKIGKRILINKDFEAYIDHDGLVLRSQRVLKVNLKIDLLQQSSAQFHEFKIHWSILNNSEDLHFESRNRVEFVDFDKTGHRVCLRTFLPGDRFIPLNFSSEKKVASFFSDKKVPHHLRRQTPILESSKGIVWIAGYGIDDRFKVTHQTKRRLKLVLIDNSNAA